MISCLTDAVNKISISFTYRAFKISTYTLFTKLLCSSMSIRKFTVNMWVERYITCRSHGYTCGLGLQEHKLIEDRACMKPSTSNINLFLPIMCETRSIDNRYPQPRWYFVPRGAISTGNSSWERYHLQQKQEKNSGQQWEQSRRKLAWIPCAWMDITNLSFLTLILYCVLAKSQALDSLVVFQHISHASLMSCVGDHLWSPPTWIKFVL